MELSLRHDLQVASDAHPRSELTLGEATANDDATAILVIGAALVSLFLKLAIAYNTFGTNDVTTFYMFARGLNQHGLEWTYQHGNVFSANLPLFNHPPLTAYYLQLIDFLSTQELFRASGLTFPFLLRLPGVIADFIVVLVFLQVRKTVRQVRLPRWALLIFALSPASLMVSGFHGNSDPVMVLFLVGAAWACLGNRPMLAGLFCALSCQIKVVPFLLLPALFFFWSARRRIQQFAVPFGLMTAVLWIQPLVQFPSLFVRNVFGYSSYWGNWGLSYWLRLTQWEPFNGTGAFHLPPVAAATVFALKCFIVGVALAIAWRRRLLDSRALIDSLAYTWIVFFVFAPGVAPQYLIWLAPFVLILSPQFYLWLLISSSVFLFFFYNATAGGLPWYSATSTNDLEALNLWSPWSLWPWATLLFGLVLWWRRALAMYPSLRLSRLLPLQAEAGIR